MELTYPINLVGFEVGSASGDVLSRDGEFLGNWTFFKDENNETGVLSFIADGEVEPKFSEPVYIFDSNIRVGLAMSNLCNSIRDWHEGHGKPS